EAGNFDKFEQSDTGILIDQESVRPGMALLEKEISGAYLYKHFNAILKLNHIDFPELTATKELDAILEDTSSDIYPIASMLLERAAGFTSAAIAAITLFKRADTIFVMEGSLFWSARYFRQNVKKMLLLLVPEYTITFIKIDDSPIFGAARLIG
ncbi:MAG: hypothetical protein Q8Q49_01155, partial [bacterium]|nr:hypothetical protein [bacterium]